MNRRFSRKQFLSYGVLGGVSLLGFECTLDDSTVPPSGSSTSSGAGGSSTGASTTTTGGGMGTAGSGTTATTGSTGGSAGAGGSTGSGGGGGGTTGGSAGVAGGGGGGAGGGDASIDAKDAGSDRSVREGGGDGSAMCAAQVAASISQNHVANPHGLYIPPADIAAGVTKVYATANVPGMPAQTHMHYVQVTAQDFATLKAGGTVTKRSCNSTTHQFVLQCDATPPAGGAPACNGDTTCGSMMTNPC